MDFIQIACFKEHKDIAVEETSGYRETFIKRQCLPVTTWNKKELSKQVVTIAYILEKTFFAVSTFEVL